MQINQSRVVSFNNAVIVGPAWEASNSGEFVAGIGGSKRIFYYPTSNYFSLFSSTNTETVRLAGESGGTTYFNAGNVGIGVTNPDRTFQVNGSGFIAEFRSSSSDLRMQWDSASEKSYVTLSRNRVHKWSFGNLGQSAGDQFALSTTANLASDYAMQVFQTRLVLFPVGVSIGTAQEAAAAGDLSAGLSGDARLFYDQSAALLSLYGLSGTAASLRLYDAGSSNYVGHTVPALSANTTYTWPASASAGKSLFTDGSGTLSWETSFGIAICEGRLTLTSGTPITTSDVTAATTVYFAPYKGNRIALYDGTRWKLYTFSELSLSVPATTNTNYDVFIYDNSGTLTLESVAWTNDTTRATALTTQDGVYVKSGATGRRYLGSFRTTGTSGQTEDSGAQGAGTVSKRYLWNYYNRALRYARCIEDADSWTYTTATWRQANGDSTNQVEFLIGVSEDPIKGVVHGVAYPTGTVSLAVGVGIDSTSANSALTYGTLQGTATSDSKTDVTAEYLGFPGIGKHYMAWLEISTAAGTTTWFGDNGVTYVQTGLVAEIRG
jgi:hypothetical protein